MKRLILIAISFFIASLQIHSQSFSANISNGNRLCFQITDTTQRIVKIIRVNSLANVHLQLPSGNLNIPSTVKYKDVVYSVMAIDDSAFADAVDLASVSIPSSVKSIGKRAFSGCISLKNIIFPSTKPTIGESAFEKCVSVSSISFGSDWGIMELQIFSDAKSLKEVTIPARVNKISGVKMLANLEKITVDPNNPVFSSHNGLLYSKGGKTLYACPRAKKGQVSVFDGTEVIFDGAFSFCTNINEVLLPSSVHAFAFDEFSSCSNLDRIVLMSEIPPITAKRNGASVFALKSPNQVCSIQVPKDSLARYKVSICNSEGAYETLQGHRREDVSNSELISKTSINRIKKIV